MRVSKWQWTNYFKPSFTWYVAKTTDGIKSSMTDLLWDPTLFFSTGIFSSLKIENEDCEKHDQCVVGSRDPIIVEGSQDLRDQLPLDTYTVRTDYINKGDHYLIADVPTHGYVTELKLIFPMEFDMSMYVEQVRMAEPFNELGLRALNTIRDMPVAISANDGELSKDSFVNKLWADGASAVEIAGTSMHLNSIMAAIVLATVVFVDILVSWLPSRRSRRRQAA